MSLQPETPSRNHTTTPSLDGNEPMPNDKGFTPEMPEVVDGGHRASISSTSSAKTSKSRANSFVKHPEMVSWKLFDRVRRRNDLMLSIARSLLSLEGGLEDTERMMISKVVEMVQCEYCILYLADKENRVLRPIFFDTATKPDDATAQEFTIPFGFGISGHVYRTGKTLNVPDIYSDPRLSADVKRLERLEKIIGKRVVSGIAVPIFSSKGMKDLGPEHDDELLDQPTARTATSTVLDPLPSSFISLKSLHNLPIPERADRAEFLNDEAMEDRNDMIGVLFLFNKMDPDTNQASSFDEQDERDAEALAVFCGIAFDKASLMHQVREQRRRRDIALDVMSYHNTATPEMVEEFMKTKWKRAMEEDLGLESLTWNPHFMEDDELVMAHIRMLSNLGFVTKYEIPETVLVRFFLTLGRNYRHRSDVAYHNFGHATAVTHGMYLLAKYFDLNSLITEELDIFALMLACACHDTDHRGTNNTFQKAAHTALFEEYVSSTMEEHHANFSLTLLTAPGHNILDTLPSKAFKRVISVMKRCIIATDLGLYFKRRPLLTQLIENHTLDLVNDSYHRNLVRSLLMNCCDLAAMYRPFPMVVQVVNIIYEEFFKQGDQEKKMGLPVSEALMDREKEKEIPQQQVGFMKNVCEGQYHLLVELLPLTKMLLERLKVNRENWQKWVDLKAGYDITKCDIPWDYQPEEMPSLPRATWSAMQTGSRLSAIDFRYKWIGSK